MEGLMEGRSKGRKKGRKEGKDRNMDRRRSGEKEGRKHVLDTYKYCTSSKAGRDLRLGGYHPHFIDEGIEAQRQASSQASPRLSDSRVRVCTQTNSLTFFFVALVSPGTPNSACPHIPAAGTYTLR